MPSIQDELTRQWREQWGRLLAMLTARYRRLDLAEDALADAFEAASRSWPAEGVPANPAGWLQTVAQRRVLDRLRAETVAARREQLLVVEAVAAHSQRSPRADPGGLLGDERLRLVLLCAHPALSAESAAALALRLVIGLSVADIADLFLATEGAVAARITRAKAKIVNAGVPFTLPGAAELRQRTDRAAEIAYLAFTAGYVPGPGVQLHRVEIAGEALRLAQVVREVAGPSAVLDSVTALMLLQHSRRATRQDTATGALVLLPDQDRSRWHHDEIAEALALLRPHLSGTPSGLGEARLLEALIAAEHAIAPVASATRWDRIVDHYTRLEKATGSPVVRLNRAVAVAEHHGPRAGMELLTGLEEDLGTSHRLPAVRAELERRTGDLAAARRSYDLALARCTNEVERAHLTRRRHSLDPPEQ